jgi:hypothetical protein
VFVDVSLCLWTCPCICGHVPVFSSRNKLRTNKVHLLFRQQMKDELVCIQNVGRISSRSGHGADTACSLIAYHSTGALSHGQPPSAGTFRDSVGAALCRRRVTLMHSTVVEDESSRTHVRLCTACAVGQWGKPTASHMVSSRFIGPSHEMSKQLY